MRKHEDFAREIDAHIEHETARLVAEGLNPDDARARAQKAFGNVTGARERFHESRQVMWFEDLRKDVVYALRTLRRNPGFAAVAVLTLALGIGATTAIFSVVNAVLVRPLPYPDAERLVTIVENRPALEPFDGRPARRPPLGEEIQELARRTRTLANVHVYGGAPEMPVPGREEERGIPGARLSGEAMVALGARPHLGRLFAPGEVDQVVVLGYEAWRLHFGADPAVLGRTVTVEQGNVPSMRRTEVYTIIGVMAEGFRFPGGDTQYWMPRGGGLNVARLAPGISREAAATEVSTLLHRIAGKPEVPLAERSGPPRFEVVGMQDQMVAAVRPGLRLLAGAIGLVLLIACVNVANLLLARASVRHREIAVRAAIGASRGRLVRQLLTESLTLAVFSGGVGTLLALAGVASLRSLFAVFNQAPLFVRQVGFDPASGPRPFPRLDEIGVDVQAFAFAIALSLVTGVTFGLAPALRHVRAGRFEALRNAATTSLGGLRLAGRQAARSLLVVAEIAMAMTLLAGGGLLIHSFVRLVTVDPGYDASGVLTFQVHRPASRSSGPELTALGEELVRAFRGVPGVRAGAYSASLPMTALAAKFTFKLTPGERVPEPDTVGPSPPTEYSPDIRLVSRGYFETLGIRLVAGRGLREGDNRGASPVLVINETVARRRFPGRSPVGAFLYGPGERPWEIVGVVADARHQTADRPPEPQAFMDFRQWPVAAFPFNPFFTVRVAGGTDSVIGPLRTVLQRIDPEARIENVGTLESMTSASLIRPRTYALLIGVFAAVAVALAAIGIYGVMAYAVSQSTKEIGIRLALGSERREVMHLVLRQGMSLAAAGITIGLVLAAGMTRYLQGMLFGVAPLDPATFTVVAVFFALVAALASFIPARRATRVDPLVALRYE